MEGSKLNIKFRVLAHNMSLVFDIPPTYSMEDLISQISYLLESDKSSFALFKNGKILKCNDTDEVQIYISDGEILRARPTLYADSKSSTFQSGRLTQSGGKIRVQHGKRISALTAASTRAATRPSPDSTAWSERKRKKEKMLFENVSNEEDISTTLLSAVEIGAAGKKNKILRSVFRRAVELQYDHSKAVQRLAAARSGKYTMTESQSIRTLAALPGKMTIYFSKGIEGNDSYCDTIDSLSLNHVII